MSISDVQAVIDSAKSRGTESLERVIRERLRGATDTEVRDATELALEIIESVPLFLARARQEAEERQLTSVVTPLLNHAEGYFVQPVDLIPEMTQGLAGLLDDSYLVLRILQNLDRGPDRFLDWDLGHPFRIPAPSGGRGNRGQAGRALPGRYARYRVRRRPAWGTRSPTSHILDADP